jgi:hypothetical protein
VDWYALPGIEAEAAFELERNSSAMLDHYIEIAKERVLKDGCLAPLTVFRSETKENIVHCGTMMENETTKDRLAVTLRRMALEFEAIGFVFAAEAWTAKYDRDDPEAGRTMPSQSPDRIECIVVSAQYKGDKPIMRVCEIVRDVDKKITHLLERERLESTDDMTFEGRFAGVLDDESDDDRWTRMTRDL